ncbi:MAG TPA: glutathione S-transferase family protein, partial [Burkholderiales bacterium]|nr:glutathione S-transferase family protein [Burkholderiales bacterium]
KLFLNKTSPYARLVLVTAIEVGLAGRIELQWTEPWNDPPELLALNPLAKVPTLLTDDGVALIESNGICDYLIVLARRDDLLPSRLDARTDALRRLGLARGVTDCAFGAVIQRRFNDGKTTALAQRWLKALPRAATAIDAFCADRLGAGQPDLADLATAVAFDYVGFRLPEIAWRDGATALGALVDKLTARPSFKTSAPQ